MTSNDILPRHALPWAEELAVAFPVVVIEGARQVGKSTLATMLVEGSRRAARYLTLDDELLRNAAQSDPQAFVDQLPDGMLVIDEIQRAPELLLPIKASVDRNRTPGRFLLTGSADLLRLERTPDSLAGRAVTLTLGPLSQGEIRGRVDDFVTHLLAGIDPFDVKTSFTREDYANALAAGGYPEVFSRSPRLRTAWFDGYLDRIVQRDARDVRRLVDGNRLATVLRLIAANQSGEIVRARLSRDADIPETTISAYLDLAETLYLMKRIRPWTGKLTTRQTGKAKGLIIDSGLAMHLSGVTAARAGALVGGGELLGPLLEGLVVSELLKQRTWSDTRFNLFHYRETSGAEVDVVLELDDGRILGIEVKAKQTYKPEHFRGLQRLAERLGDRFAGGVVLGTADQGVRFGENLIGLPIASLWEL
ncbi:ATP-binding protein [Tsukamurella sp. NPDC003166]|uniref:ATP-binding protein n=1 Tax=Tsukamurella sp. NPDC003166 TaxID=3154444 RepID=UPI0033A3BFA1